MKSIFKTPHGLLCALVASKFGAICPEPDYDPNCDMTSPGGLSNGKIDIQDIAQAAKYFGDVDP